MAQLVKNLPAMQETHVRSLGQEDPWRRKWQATLVFLLENSTERAAWQTTVYGVAKESDMTQRLTRCITLSWIYFLLSLGSFKPLEGRKGSLIIILLFISLV